LDYIGQLAGERIIKETDDAQIDKITWRQHSSARGSRFKDDPSRFTQLLEIVAEQTSLQFRKGRQREQVWRVEHPE